MPLNGNPVPEVMDEALVRTKEQVQVFDSFVVNDTNDHPSEEIICRSFREFALFLSIDSTGSPTTLHIQVEFLDGRTGKWHTYKQGPFASLYYEDEDTASGIFECFTEKVPGRFIRVKLTGAGTDSSNYFTVSATLDLRN